MRKVAAVVVMVVALCGVAVAGPLPASAATTLSTVPGTAYLDAVSCGSPTTCVAVGYSGGSSAAGIFVTISDGKVGKVVTVVGTGQLVDVSCPTAKSCEATANGNGKNGVVAITKGKAGRFRPVAGASLLTGISCASATVCEAIGNGPSPKGQDNNSGVAVAIAKGKPGSARTMPGTSATGLTMWGVACTKDDTCYGTGSGLFGTNITLEAVVDPIRHGTPGSPSLVAGEYELDNIACTSDSSCWAVGVFFGSSEEGALVPVSSGGQGGVVIVEGTQWLYGISCPSTSFCMGSGNNGDSGEGVLFTISSGIASGATVVDGSSNLDGMSCVSSADCEASGANSNVFDSQEGVVVEIGSTVKVNPGVTLSSSPKSPSPIGKTLKLTETVTARFGGPTPTGRVTFTNGSAVLCKGVKLSKGAAICRVRTAKLGVGKRLLTGAYSGNSHYNPSSSLLHYTVTKAKPSLKLSASPKSPSPIGKKLKLTEAVGRAKAGPTPTGTVTFTNGSEVLCKGASVSEGTATCKTTTAKLGVGKHVLTAAYSGDSSYRTASSSVGYTVKPKKKTKTASLKLSASREVSGPEAQVSRAHRARQEVGHITARRAPSRATTG
jgi:hypothetical protein